MSQKSKHMQANSQMSLDKGHTTRHKHKISAYDSNSAKFTPPPKMKIDTLINRHQAFLKKMSIETSHQLESQSRRKKMENMSEKHFQSLQEQKKNLGLQL